MKAKVVDHLFKKLDSHNQANFRTNGVVKKSNIHEPSYLKAIQDLVEFYAEEEQKKTNKDCNPS